MQTIYAGLLDLYPGPAFVWADSQLLAANRAFVDLVRAESPEDLHLINPLRHVLAAHRPQLLRLFEETLTGGSQSPWVEATIIRRDEEQVRMEVSAAQLDPYGTLQVILRSEAGDEQRVVQQLRILAAGQQKAIEQERARIARDLHDELGQRLTVLKFELANLESSMAPGGPESDRLRGALDSVDSILETTRRIAANLRPALLDELELPRAFEELARIFELQTNVRVSFLCLDDPQVKPEQRMALFRVFQESLTNVVRHSGAAHAWVSLRNTGSEAELEVRDDGRGMSAADLLAAGKLGLLGMRERMTAWGGTLEIFSEPGAGTTVRARIQRRDS
ncbi:MAG: sensor histidine kinase [Bryobacteraceae bacterium]|nr:sensor histidine kinase [Bryobacteraceae bacterium]